MNTKDNSGALWGNRDKKNERHPDFKGECVIDGTAYWIAAWKRDPDNQNPKAPALRLSFTAKDDAHKQGFQEARQAVSTSTTEMYKDGGDYERGTEFDDDVPF